MTDNQSNPSDYKMTKEVEEMRDIPITGNVIPTILFKEITFDNGKPNLVAIIILSDMINNQTPLEVRDEQTGQVIECEPKVPVNYPQGQLKYYSKMFRFSERQVRDALKLLKNKGYICGVVS